MTAAAQIYAIDAATDTGSDADCRIAGSRDTRIAAFELVYRKYVAGGLIEPNRFRMRVTPYHLLRTTGIFVAIERGRVICTMTLVGDGELGLPMDCVYPAEIRERRQNELYVGEVSCLAFEPMVLSNFLAVFMRLTRLMAQHARRCGMDQFLIAVHPQHARFYERFMGFQRIGALRTFPTVRNAPAVALCLDFAAIDRNRPKCWTSYFGTRLPAAELRSQPMSVEERCYFGPMVEIGKFPNPAVRAA